MKKYNNICPICKKKVAIPSWKYCSDECRTMYRNKECVLYRHKKKSELLKK